MKTSLLAALVVVLVLVAPRAAADAGWFEAGDLLMRQDLQLLNDADVIRLPVGQWPMPRAAVRYALANARVHLASNAAVTGALSRVRSRLTDADRRAGSRFTLDTSLVAGERALLRDFGTLGRETAEVSARATVSPAERLEMSLRVTGVADPVDDRSLRLDGSHATVRLGNWMLGAQTLDRWWGPGHDGSLILSNNARPMPSLVIERAEARPFESRLLNWLGPWRFNFGVGQMEGDRQDIDSPLFMAWRVSIMPFKDMEIGFSRTAQFCGDQLVCDVDSFFNMLAGNDNVGIDATPETEPGNQMAGFDLRWHSPIGSGPYAIYSQAIGEDESSYLPAKYLFQYGIETWKPFSDGGIAQVFAEYSTTTCSAHSNRGPYYNCAYNQGLFNIEGYRYRGRVIGHTADRDAENWSAGVTYTTPAGELWRATARRSRLNRDDVGDVRNTVASVPTDYAALELGWRGEVFGQPISIDLGVEGIEPIASDRKVHAFGFVSWRHEFGMR